MCASYEARFSVTQLVEAFDKHGAPLVFPRGRPNIEPVDEVRPTDLARAVRATTADAAELVPLRFGLRGPARPGGKAKPPPVINFRSEGRAIGNGETTGRALVPASGFYEFTGDTYPRPAGGCAAPTAASSPSPPSGARAATASPTPSPC